VLGSRGARSRRSAHRSGLAVAVLATASLLFAPEARGAFAGTNGAIAYVVSNGITPYRTDDHWNDSSPSWSPDGRGARLR
jgi:hypothetical protein